jgi:hypothetical protein
MAHRSLHVITKVHYRSMSCFATVSQTKDPACSAKVSPIQGPPCTIWVRHLTKYDANPHSTEQDTLPIAFLISKQVVPYRTCGGTCCPRVSTPKIWSIADSRTTCHDGINHLDNIIPHTVNSHLGGWKTTTLSQRHKPNSTLQRMEDLYDTQDYREKHS